MRSRRRDAEPAVDRETRRSRKRFARRQWRRRWRVWRLGVVLVLIVAVVVTGVYAVGFSSWLAVDRVRVNGLTSGGPLDADRVREVARVPVGEPLASLDLDWIAARVGALAPVRSVDVTRSWPHAVEIDIEERTAVAVVQIGQELRGLDADGVAFVPYETAPPGLPRVQTGADTSAEALKEGATVVTSLPTDLTGRVDHVEVVSIDQIALVLTNGKRVEWGSADDSDLKAEVLQQLLKQDAQVYDVSVPGQPVTRGGPN